MAKIGIKRVLFLIGTAFLFFGLGGIASYYINIRREEEHNIDAPLFRNPDSPPQIIGPSGHPPFIN